MEQQDQVFHFSTNINCGGCVASVSHFLDHAEGIQHWKVDTDKPGKILTVRANGISQEQVMDKVRQAGFSIEAVAHSDEA
jgi:copper chaperone